ncbi:MAG: MBL fold metallo-hydrolase [Mycoplasmatales bacterium]
MLSLASSSHGNCYLYQFENLNILIDVGLSYTKIKKTIAEYGLTMEEIDLILISHEHIDHIRGVEVLKKNVDIPIYLTNGTLQALTHPLDNYTIIKAGDRLKIEELELEIISISHDANEPCGFILYSNEHKYVHITDTGYITDNIMLKTQNADFYLIESNYEDDMLIVNPKYPFVTKKRILSDKGHLSNIQCKQYIETVIGDRTKIVCFGHLSPNNNHPELVEVLHENLVCDYQVLQKEQVIEVEYANRYYCSR